MEVDGCSVPDDRLYDLENDVWLKLLDDGASARIGLPSWIGAFAGRFHSVAFRPIEGFVEKGRSVATVESVRYTGAVRMPVGGTPRARNPALAAHPKLLNDRPYDEGWVVEVELADAAEPLRTMETAERIAGRLAEKIVRWRIRCYPALPDSELYEIGAECQAVLARLDEEIRRRAPEETVLLVTDDPTAPIEMVRWEDRTGHRVIHHRREGNLHHFLVRRVRDPVPRTR